MTYKDDYISSINSVNPAFYDHPNAKEILYTLSGSEKRYERKPFTQTFGMFSLAEQIPLLGVYLN